ncbi:MAG: MmgE/PrpD family protein [Hydrogenophaga sp.]|jgi:2-methylcitrate dehydratase PrpD|uniref:MmgE/PrpD family protein n=1 Tax=Hydrogenophaga sp. TaxID=1904254 RepID=UPI001D79B48D|nr:MmgE/PrpD family protein [Hydrogenophaga sp.]MBW0170831.1 MmgE/PrpD family protein [Hydrogenophaga sp.]MBW0185710.1 MmgE/PrpD family protein [Hydrogenophaga sp.]
MDRLPEARLAAHVHALRDRPLSTATRERLAQALLDWFTAGWAALDMPATPTLQALARISVPGTGPSPVFGGGGLQPMGAAFANAGIAHLREIDDAHRAAMLHPGVVAISPVLALSAAHHMPLRRLADAIIAGYEVALRVGEVLGTRHAAHFHATATAGAVGAAAASAVALGLSQDQLHHAMGIAATQSAGLWQLVDDEAHASKSLHPAFAVRNGMMAAWAAQAGFPGARAFVTGQRGLYALLAGDGSLAALDGDLDAPERVNTATIKAWPCCAQLFTPLDATLEILDAHRPVVDDIATVEVVIFPHALKIAGVHWPTHAGETPFCLRYVIATLLSKGHLGIAEMEAPDLQSSELLALAERIQVSTSDEFQRAFPHKRPAQVTLTTKNGERWSVLRELRRGDPEDPFTWAQLQARMRAFAPEMDDAQAGQLTRWCETFADPALDDMPCTLSASLFGSSRVTPA